MTIRSLCPALLLLPFAQASGGPLVFSPADTAHSMAYQQDGLEEHLLESDSGDTLVFAGIAAADKHTYEALLIYRNATGHQVRLDPRECSLLMSSGSRIASKDGQAWVKAHWKRQERNLMWASVASRRWRLASRITYGALRSW